MDVVQRRKGNAPAGAHKVKLGRARLAVIERDHYDARNVRKRGLNEQLVRCRKELCFDTMRRRAKRKERFGKKKDEFLPMVHRCRVGERDRRTSVSQDTPHTRIK